MNDYITNDNNIEDPCEIDGQSCEWIWDDYSEGDQYCVKCFRYRDWDKEIYETTKREKTDTNGSPLIIQEGVIGLKVKA